MVLEDWQVGWHKVVESIVLQKDIEYTLYALLSLYGLDISNVTANLIYKYYYDLDLMVSLDFIEYFPEENSTITINSLISQWDGAYFDFTGESKAIGELVHDHWWENGFLMNINAEDIFIDPFFNDVYFDFSNWFFFRESYTKVYIYQNEIAFLNNGQNNITYLNDIESEDIEVSFRNRELNFEYAPNYADLTEEEFTITSSGDCHPLLQWTSVYANFFIENQLEDYFETEIWRMRKNLGKVVQLLSTGMYILQFHLHVLIMRILV